MAQFSAWSMTTSVIPAGLRLVVPLVRASAACAASTSPWLPWAPGSYLFDHFVFLLPLGEYGPSYGPPDNSSHTGREGLWRRENLCNMGCEIFALSGAVCDVWVVWWVTCSCSSSLGRGVFGSAGSLLLPLGMSKPSSSPLSCTDVLK